MMFVIGEYYRAPTSRQGEAIDNFLDDEGATHLLAIDTQLGKTVMAYIKMRAAHEDLQCDVHVIIGDTTTIYDSRNEGAAKTIYIHPVMDEYARSIMDKHWPILAIFD
jgi:hypothetical protein